MEAVELLEEPRYSKARLNKRVSRLQGPFSGWGLLQAAGDVSGTSPDIVHVAPSGLAGEAGPPAVCSGNKYRSNFAGLFQRRNGICLHSEAKRRSLGLSAAGSQCFHSTSRQVCRLAATIVEPLKPT
jgi:hypothetical protein